MNYASMIEEKHLKKGFILATLISTVIGTFTTSIGLYERISDRRRQQHQTDHGQNDKIQELERRADAADRARRKAEEEVSKLELEHVHGRRSLRDELAASGPMIRREYDRSYARFGAQFADGDQIAQNALQAQIIEMQASVIRLLQDALVDGTMPDPAALYAAAGRARSGSIRALSDQYQRMLAAAPIGSRGTVHALDSGSAGTGRRALRSASAASSSRSGYAEPGDWRRAAEDGTEDGTEYGTEDGTEDRRFRRHGVGRKRRSLSQAAAGTRRASTFPMLLPPPPPAPPSADADPRPRSGAVVVAQPPLFCRYSIQLQKDWRRPLALGSEDGSSSGGGGGGGLVCPSCLGSFAIEHDRSWKIHKPVAVAEAKGAHELVQGRLFVVSNRFIVKCHRPAAAAAAHDGLEPTLRPPAYACCLCDQFDADGKITVCSTMARLVNHVCEKHSVGELLSDPDIREVRGRG